MRHIQSGKAAPNQACVLDMDIAGFAKCPRRAQIQCFRSCGPHGIHIVFRCLVVIGCCFLSVIFRHFCSYWLRSKPTSYRSVNDTRTHPPKQVIKCLPASKSDTKIIFCAQEGRAKCWTTNCYGRENAELRGYDMEHHLTSERHI